MSLFLPHGGGPLPILNDPSHKDLIRLYQQKLVKWIKTPKAIVLVTAHWETSQPIISAAPQHSLLYDYYGFPPESYQIEYKAPGSPQVAQRVHQALKEAGFSPSLDTKRGWDHGVFIPLKLLIPDASIPIVQMSVLSNQDPTALIRMGNALKPLKQDNVLIIGSGMSFHNMRAFMSGQGFNGNLAFEEQLLSTAKLNGDQRHSALEQWKTWKGAKECHPPGATEHFSPFIVTAAAGDQLLDVGDALVLGAKVSAFLWE